LKSLSKEINNNLFEFDKADKNIKKNDILKEKKEILEIYLKENKFLDEYENEKERIRKLNKRFAADLGKQISREKLLDSINIKLMKKKSTTS
jgi:hypothetical protein